MHTQARCMDPNTHRTPAIQYFGAWVLVHISMHTYTHALCKLCRSRSLACYIIQEGVYQQVISSSLKTLKGCFVFLLLETPWTHRLPSSHAYLFTTAWICKSLSWLPAVTDRKCFTHSLSVPEEPQVIQVFAQPTFYLSFIHSGHVTNQIVKYGQ